MQDFQGKVAVVTGAGSGIGRALAERFAGAGMNVVLAGRNRETLEETARAVRTRGADALVVPTDVADGAAVEALAQQTLDAFGAVHILCNNAGVTVYARSWEATAADWEWVLGVNLWGVIHGIRAFVPVMLSQQSEAHIVNTASAAGLITAPVPAAPYTVSKHAVVALSELLAKELELAAARVKVSVLCPGFVRTNILTSDRNRPAHLRNPAGVDWPAPDDAAADIAGGAPPEEIADLVLAAIRQERFYILPDPMFMPAVRTRLEEILAGRNPSLWPGGG